MDPIGRLRPYRRLVSLLSPPPLSSSGVFLSRCLRDPRFAEILLCGQRQRSIPIVGFVNARGQTTEIKDVAPVQTVQFIIYTRLFGAIFREKTRTDTERIHARLFMDDKIDLYTPQNFPK